MPSNVPLANGCFLAGGATKELWDATNSALTWVEQRDAKLLGSSFFSIGQKAGTLSMILKGRARAAAAELSKRSKAARETLRGKRTLTKPQRKAYEAEIFRMKDRSYWLEVAAKAHCGDRMARQSMVRSKVPSLTTKPPGKTSRAPAK